MTFHVLIPDNVDQSAIDLLVNAEGITVNAPGKLSQADAQAAIAEAHAIIIRSGIQADADLIAAAPNLKIIARAGVGVDNVDLDAATRQGVVVVNTPGGNTISTAEHTFGLMLALARHIPEAEISMRSGQWDRKSFSGVELRGKTLGIIGFGRIGRAIASRAQAFEMTVIAADPFVSPEVGAELGVEIVSQEEVFQRADFLTLHAVITPETKGMINAESIATMKRGVRIVNASRGALIVEEDLAEAIKSGHVAGAALDVYAVEPPSSDNPLIGLSGVVHTPHLAASTSDAQVTVAVEAAQLVIVGLLQGKYENVVNPAVLEG